MDARSWPFFSPKARARDAMRNRLWFFRIIPWNQPRRSSLFFLPLSEALCWMHRPIFFRLPFSPSLFSTSGRVAIFFSVESTPENSRRHLVAELLITASLHAPMCPILRLSLSLLSSCCFFLFPDLEFWALHVCTYGNRRIPRARLLGTNETPSFAWCRLANGVASRRIASHRIASHRTGEQGRGGLQDYIDVETLQDHPARQYKITFVR